MQYGQESTNICCKLCQDGTGCQIPSDTRAGGGDPAQSRQSLNGVMSLWDLVVWHVNALLSNEVQVEWTGEEGQPSTFPMEWESDTYLTSPNVTAFNQNLSPAAREASRVKTFLLQSSLLLYAVAKIKCHSLSQLSCSSKGLIKHKQNNFKKMQMSRLRGIEFILPITPEIYLIY